MYVVSQLQAGRAALPNFIYWIADPDSKDAVIIDPGWDHELILGLIAKDGLNLRAILLTHSDGDHVRGVDHITDKFPVPVYMTEVEIQQSGFTTPGLAPCHHEEILCAGTIQITCLLTPGHTLGSACFLIGENLFTGDTVFIEGCGYCRPPRGSASAMYRSFHYLRTNIRPHVLVFPAHKYGMAPGVPMDVVQKHNIYFRLRNEGSFAKFSEFRGVLDFDDIV